MKVVSLILISLLLIDFASFTNEIQEENEIDSLVVHEKIDRAGKIQDGGAQDLEKILTKGIMDEFESDKFFNS
jgi:hypothetical protein